MASDVLILEKHRELFKDDESIQKFVRLLQESTQNKEMQLVLYGESLVGALISTEEAKNRLHERIAKRLTLNPGSVEALKERLQSDDIVQ